MYERLTPLVAAKHSGLRLLPTAGYAFAAKETHVRLGLSEFGHVCGFLPTAFVETNQGRIIPVAVLGLQQGRNLMVAEDGRWLSPVIPAAVRIHPFAMARNGADSFAMGVDEASSRLSTTEGDPLYGPDGMPTPTTSRIFDENRAVLRDQEMAATFAEALRGLSLLRPIAVKVTTADGPLTTAGGIRVLDEAAFRALPEAQILAWWKNGYLAPIFAHLVSLAHFQVLGRRAGIQAPVA